MGKLHEIDYISRVAEIDNVPLDDFNNYLLHKPFSDPRCGEYLMDIAQVMNLLPPPPARLLDIGVGSGWTSELFARRGYEVVGLDISPDMIDLAKQRCHPNLSFQVCDYESGPIASNFDVAVIYDSLHHAENEFLVVTNIFAALAPGGMLITVEPGAGHSQTADSIEVMRKYGTTEKDMPFSLQIELMQRAGFRSVQQYARLSQLPLSPLSTRTGAMSQVRHALSLAYGSATGLTSIAVAMKDETTEQPVEAPGKIAEALLALAAVHDQHILGTPPGTIEEPALPAVQPPAQSRLQVLRAWLAQRSPGAR